MLPDKNRLKKDKDFKNVFRNGRFFNFQYITLRFKRNNIGVSRFGFVVGNKISKKSSERNLIKRRLREVVRKILKNTKSGLDIVIIVRPGILNKKFREIDEDIYKLFKRARIAE